jgi:hypothetical protein
MSIFSPVGAGLTRGRTDQGVDFSGGGALYAVDSGTILATSNPGWPGGTFIALQLDHPVDALHSVIYYAEDIAPSVSVGQRVTAGQQIGRATGGTSGIEIGWADPSRIGASLASAEGSISGATTAGQNFLAWITGGSALGANQTPPMVGATSVDQYAWAAFLISQINAKGNLDIAYSANNIDKIVQWMTAEESSSNWWHNNNPLNVNASGTGSDTFPNLTVGAETAAESIIGHPDILATFTQDSSPQTFSAVVVASTWAKSHYGGDPSHISDIALPAPVIAPGGLPSSFSEGITPANPFPGPLGAAAGLATGGTSVPSAPSWTSELATLLGDLTSSAWWQRVGLFAGGVVLVIGGLVLFITTTKTGQQVESDTAVAAAA